jgi:hypothetical protein
MCSSPNFRHHVSHPHRTTGKSGQYSPSKRNILTAEVNSCEKSWKHRAADRITQGLRSVCLWHWYKGDSPRSSFGRPQLRSIRLRDHQA